MDVNEDKIIPVVTVSSFEDWKNFLRTIPIE